MKPDITQPTSIHRLFLFFLCGIGKLLAKERELVASEERDNSPGPSLLQSRRPPGTRQTQPCFTQLLPFNHSDVLLDR